MHARSLAIRDPRHLLVWAALALACALGAMSAAHAASLQVSPVSIEFANDQPARALTLTNTGASEMQAQVRVMRWSQENGVDVLAPADDIVVSPAIVHIDAGKDQTVRIVRKLTTPPSRELAYRVIVDELPGAAPAQPSSGLRVLLRYSIPVFVPGAGIDTAASNDGFPRAGSLKAEPPGLTDLSHLRASLVTGSNGKAELKVSNDGPRRVRISQLFELSADGNSRPLRDGLLGYVLSGQQMSWAVDIPIPLPGTISLQARFNDDRQAQPVPLDTAQR